MDVIKICLGSNEILPFRFCIMAYNMCLIARVFQIIFLWWAG
jgi:hypothetical protein